MVLIPVKGAMVAPKDAMVALTEGVIVTSMRGAIIASI